MSEARQQRGCFEESDLDSVFSTSRLELADSRLDETLDVCRIATSCDFKNIFDGNGKNCRLRSNSDTALSDLPGKETIAAS